MPQQRGEISLLTVFADVHYFLSPPTAQPVHHRFDKRSYVYLYHDASEQRGRIEVANHAGTPNQDSFSGYFDKAHIEYSHKHPTLCTVTVEAPELSASTTSATPQQELSQWHLPAFDQRNENKYLYKLHTLDLYFWTAEDATLFVDSVKKFARESQLRILDAPVQSRHTSVVSPVVQRLEEVAITTPYMDRSSSISTTHSAAPKATTPVPAGKPGSAAGNAQFTPMAYNPAAPAAPEPIAHREKTPPPPDAESGTGLIAAAMDHGDQYGTPGSQPHGSFAQQQQPYMPGPPQAQRQSSFPPPPPQPAASGTPPHSMHRTNTSTSFPPPPPQPQGSTGPSPGQQYAQSFAPPPQNTTTPGFGTPSPAQTPQQQHSSSVYGGYPSQPQQQPQQEQPPPQYPGYSQSASGAGTPGLPPMHSPGFPPYQGQAPLQSPGLPGQQAGYGQYGYGQQQQQQAPQQQTNPYMVHGQGYTATQAESQAHAKPAPTTSAGRIEQRLEKGVGKFLKKLDKRL